MNCQKIESLTNQINTKMKEFTTKIKHEHHKQRDGVWGILFDAYQDKWVVYHHGYWLGNIDIINTDLKTALEMFQEELWLRIDERLKNYDFENHCGRK